MSQVSVETVLELALAAVASIVVAHRVGDRTGVPAGGPAHPDRHRRTRSCRGRTSASTRTSCSPFVIPPLLYSAALDSSLLAIRRNLRTVVSLSVVLVLVTALSIGVGFPPVRAGRDAGRRHRARRQRRAARPGRRARGRAQGRPAAAS